MRQKSPEWFEARSGKITASRLGDVIANQETKRYQSYLAEVASELSGAPYMEDDKPWFRHGGALEPDGRARYEFEKLLLGEDIEVEEVGFILHPEYDYIGCSPDGLMPKKGLEIKSSISHANFKKMAKTDLPSNHKPQVQGSLWITGLESWDFVLFFRDPDGLLPDEIKISNIKPDLEYHKMLEEKCLEFWEAVEGMVLAYEWVPE